MTPVLCFDIETIPDALALRALYEPELLAESGQSSLSDTQIVELALARRREKTGSDFLPLHQQRIVAIACLLRDEDGLLVRCLGSSEDDESKLLRLFYRQIERYTPQMVSWNGGGFDLPVMHYRCLINGVAAPRYWDVGEEDRDFKWNNYLARFHQRHLDLMDVLAMYSLRASAPLDELAKICGFPGKLGMDGSKVWEQYLDGEIDQIRAYCETDVANTYLMYCRFELIRGHWDKARYDSELATLREVISASDAPHWQSFLAAWTTDRLA